MIATGESVWHDVYFILISFRWYCYRGREHGMRSQSGLSIDQLNASSIIQVLDWGVPMNQIKLLCLLGSMPGIQNVIQQCPGLEIVIAGLDEELNAKGYVVPGCGDVSHLSDRLCFADSCSV